MSALVPLAVWVAGAILAFGLIRRDAALAPPWLTAAALGPAAGFGLLSLAYFCWRLAGWSAAGFQLAGWAGLAAAAAAGLALARRPRPLATDRVAWRRAAPDRLTVTAVALFLAALALALVAWALYARQLPYGSFDAWAIWNSRARLLHRGGDLQEIYSMLRRPHADYPLLVPGGLAAQFALAGGESPRIHQLTGISFAFATALSVVVAALQLGAARRWAWVAGALLLCTPKFLYWGAAQCADVPLAYLLLVATLSLAALFSRERRSPLPAAAVGFLLGLPAWTKNEGMILSVLLLAVFAVAAWRAGFGGHRARWWPVAAGALVPWSAALLFRGLWAPRTDLGHFAGDLLSRLLEAARWQTVAAAFGRELVAVGGFRLWGAVWIVAAAALCLGLARSRNTAAPLQVARYALLLCWLAWFGVFVGTPMDLAWHLRTALDRLLLQLLPLTLAVGFAGLGWPRRRGAGARSGSVAALLLAVLLAGCASRPAGPDAVRLIEIPALDSLDPGELARELEVAAWDFRSSPGGATGWTATSGVATETAGALSLVPDAARRASLIRDVEFEAEDVDVFRLLEPRLAGGTLTLYWAAPGERFVSTRRVDVRLEGRREGFESEDAVVVVVRGHPQWRGPIGHLRLDYGNANARPVELRRMRAARRLIDDDAVAAAASRAWRVELDHEVRSAFVGADRRALDWPLPEISGHALHFGFGTEAAVGGAVTFRVFADGAGEAREVFAATVGDGGRAADRWHDVVVPAAELAGATRLRLTVQYPERAEARRSLAYWSDPELRREPAGGRRPDVLLVSIDTLRPDHLSLYGHSRPTTPELDRWARTATVFEKVVTTSPWTLPAHLSMFTGLDAVRHGVNHRGRVPRDLTTLAESLRAAGYETMAITGGGFLAPEYGLDQGFDRYRYWPDHTAEEELVAGVDTAARWLAAPGAKPLFLFFHTYEVHYPYRPRSPYFERFAAGRGKPGERDLSYVNLPSESASGYRLTKEWRAADGAGGSAALDAEDQRLLEILYDSGIAFADAQVARLLARWEDRPRAADSAVAITSDHGDALGEKGLAGHAYVEDFNALVPLVVRFPGGRPAGRVAAQVRLIDLAPTLLEIAGVAPAAELDGISLRPLAQAGGGEHRPGWTYAAFSDRGLALRIGDRWKYTFNNTVWHPLHGAETLYDLRRDPAEETAVAADPVRLEPLRARAQAHLASTAGALRIRVDNASGEPLTGLLLGAVLEPTRLKSPRLPLGGLGWERPKGIALRAASGEAYDLLLESPAPGRLTVILEPGFRAPIDLAALDAPWRAARRAGRWEAGGPDAAEGLATVTVEWTEAGGGVTVDPATANAELRRQLAALGYVD